METSNFGRILTDIYDKPVYDIRLGVGSAILIDFDESLDPKDPLSRGKWAVTIWGHWNMLFPDRNIIGSADPRNVIEELIPQLLGHSLVKIEISHPALYTSFLFDNGISLRLLSPYSGGSERRNFLVIFTPNHHTLSLGPGSNWQYEAEMGD
jgi:hypothetical protein